MVRKLLFLALLSAICWLSANPPAEAQYTCGQFCRLCVQEGGTCHLISPTRCTCTYP
jgi:hypothetical protein